MLGVAAAASVVTILRIAPRPRTGHIYLRVGLYHQASEANQRAIELDRSYFEQCQIAPDASNYNAYYR